MSEEERAKMVIKNYYIALAEVKISTKKCIIKF